MTALIDRKTALSRQMPRYFTGEPCKRGHISARRASDGKCIACEAIARREQRNKRASHSAELPSPHDPRCGPVINPHRKKSAAEMVALRAANSNPDPQPIRSGGEFRKRPVRSASANIFSPENLALADRWARRFVEDAERRRRGERPKYPNLDEWRGHAANLLHVSGKKLGETSLTDLVLASLAAHKAAEIIAEAEAEIAA